VNTKSNPLPSLRKEKIFAFPAKSRPWAKAHSFSRAGSGAQEHRGGTGSCLRSRRTRPLSRPARTRRGRTHVDLQPAARPTALEPRAEQPSLAPPAERAANKRKIMRIFSVPPTAETLSEPNFYDTISKIRLRQQLEMYSISRKYDYQQPQNQADSVQLSLE
uniref:Small integral membrane protein 19 n=1 Tax=Sus scrofa TaxID=9823 RepID=A0A8D1ZDG2_PIG